MKLEKLFNKNDAGSSEKKEIENRFNSSDPKHVAWRVEQSKVDNFIEGISPDRDIEAFVLKLDKEGITDVNERIRRIGDFIKSKEKGAE
jgi:hypothetical protein